MISYNHSAHGVARVLIEKTTYDGSSWLEVFLVDHDGNRQGFACLFPVRGEVFPEVEIVEEKQVGVRTNERGERECWDSEAQRWRDAEVSAPTADILRRALALIDTPEKWRKACAQLACCYAAPTVRDGDRATSALANAVGWDSGNYRHSPSSSVHVWRWNDAPERTHAEVVEAFERAIEAES